MFSILFVVNVEIFNFVKVLYFFDTMVGFSLIVELNLSLYLFNHKQFKFRISTSGLFSIKEFIME